MATRRAAAWVLFGSGVGALAVLAMRRGLERRPPASAAGNHAVDDLNAQFHSAYAEARGHAENHDPIVVVLADQLVFYRGRHRTDFAFAAQAFHAIKSVAHAPVAIFAILYSLGGRAVDGETRKNLGAIQQRLIDAEPDIGAASLDAVTAEDLRAVQDASLEVIGHILRAEAAPDTQTEPPVVAVLHAFAKNLGPVLLRCTDHATRVQLQALDDAVTSLLGQMSPEELRTFHVVVTGDHQARRRSLTMQYFCKLLREPADKEHRVTYAEGICDAEAARALVGIQRLDGAIAETFFGDPKRLQRDILGDAAQARLETFGLPRIS